MQERSAMDKCCQDSLEEAVYIDEIKECEAGVSCFMYAHGCTGCCTPVIHLSERILPRLVFLREVVLIFPAKIWLDWLPEQPTPPPRSSF
jgi:hypothetical protein